MKRVLYLDLIKKYVKVFPVCAILGARQVGKTTLARQYAAEQSLEVEFFDLENPKHLASLENPMTVLEKYDNCLVVIDEIQRRPDLFPILRVLVDHPTKKYKFLILGSASRDLIHQSSETLAGRIGYIELPPFNLMDVQDSDKLLIRGGFPRSYLAETDEESFLWREQYINSFIERDLPSFGFDVSPQIMYKFWMMLCFYHGQAFNVQEISKSLMVTHKLANSYLDMLAGTFMIRMLQPWFENIRKRQVKTPKIYFRDTGIFNSLSSIYSIRELAKTPKMGPLWEGFALEQIINCFQIPSKDCYFWATSNEAELDLLVFKHGKRIGFEFKYTDSPKVTKSMQIAMQDLQLDHLYLVYPGDFMFPLQDNMTACGLDALDKILL